MYTQHSCSKHSWGHLCYPASAVVSGGGEWSPQPTLPPQTHFCRTYFTEHEEDEVGIYSHSHMVARLLVAAAALALLFPVCVCKDDLHVGHQPPPGVLNPSEEDFNDESLDVRRREEHPWASRDPSVEALLRGEPPLRGEAPEVRSAAVKRGLAMKFLRVRNEEEDKKRRDGATAALRREVASRAPSPTSTPLESKEDEPVEKKPAPTPAQIKTSFEMVFEMIYGAAHKVWYFTTRTCLRALRGVSPSPPPPPEFNADVKASHTCKLILLLLPSRSPLLARPLLSLLPSSPPRPPPIPLLHIF